MFTQVAVVNEMNKLRKFALKLTRNSNDADDLLQSTVLRAFEKKHLFRPDSNLYRWLSKIMYNLFVSEYRRKVKFETQYDPDCYIQNLSVEADQEVKMNFLKVRESMEKISDIHRQILVMVCVKGMPYEEVAQDLQIPVGTVRSRLSRARESLQALMEKSDIGVMPLSLADERLAA
jgi:RNA polymerase sigma-70 factor (ECF subfamily)